MNIENYVFVQIDLIGLHPDGSNNYRDQTRLYQYDIPRRLYDKYKWLFRWRQSIFQCKHPRNSIQIKVSFYDKKTGIEVGFNSIFGKLSSAKGQVTKIKNKIQAAKESYVGDLFHPTLETTDAYKNAICKLETYENKVIALQNELQAEKEKIESLKLKENAGNR